MIAANKMITDVKVLALEAKETAAGGGFSFDAQECFSCGEIAPDMPLVLEISFRGSLPDYAISYLDENGKREIKSINLSGYDGRLFLEDVVIE